MNFVKFSSVTIKQFSLCRSGFKEYCRVRLSPQIFKIRHGGLEIGKIL